MLYSKDRFLTEIRLITPSFPDVMAKKTLTKVAETISRNPIVVVMGHIDHGKSTLLDYIRKTNIVDKEVGGITQHLSAYVVEHESKDAGQRKITFLDTPGHAAFQKMRLRGADVADVAILVVSAEEGVKPQTLEALASITAAGIPYIVGINKIDRPGANVERTKSSLVENEIYVEGMGGTVPWVAISAKVGTGVDELLDLVLLTAELAELKGDSEAPATGVVIESELDEKRGTSATLIIKNGTLKSGQCIVSGTAYAPVRIMEDFRGKTIKEAGISEPVRIVGFQGIPAVGATFVTVASKREAEKMITENKSGIKVAPAVATSAELTTIPLLVKADTLGSLEAIEHEIDKLRSDRVAIRLVNTSVGAITDNDVRNVSATKQAIIIGFNVSTERSARELAERLGVEIASFDIIYKLAEWLEEAIKTRTPLKTIETKTGVAKILKTFSVQRHTYVLGGRSIEGVLKVGEDVKIYRRDLEIGRGKLKNLQQQKADVQSLSEGEFGMQLETKTEIAPGDTIEAFESVVI